MKVPALQFNPDVEYILRKNRSVEDWNKICNALTRPPLTTFVRVNTLKNTTDDALVHLQNFVTNVDRKQCIEKGWPNVVVRKHPVVPDVLYLTVAGPLDVVPASKEVVVDKLCGNAVLRGADIFATGVLAAESPMKKGNRVAVFVDLEGKCLRGQSKVFSGQKLFIGNGIALLGREDLYKCAAKELRGSGIGVQMTEPIYRSPSLNEIFSLGLVLQNLPSILVAHQLNPQPGDIVLDMCAAPGGKTTHIATIMRNQGTIIALDRSRQKIKRLAQYAEDQNLSSIRAYSCDATSCVMSKEETAGFLSDPVWPASGSKVQNLPREFFDRVLLDGPCSAMGQRPNFDPEGINVPVLEHYPVYQQSLLHAAHKLLKVGGTLAYSTCTFTSAENEENVAFALRTFPDLELLPVPEAYRHMRQPGLSGIEGLSEEHRQSCWRFDPGESCGTGADGEPLESIGFFFAIFRKNKI
ncbi:S-adenosyl-L-methionine-dependent methyltransferase [Phlyctochytrium arcticum]|nr:S-adenosyl-L-methionine-dependent methyltransferase [Phlyctochytrium arcticum]